MAEIFPDDGHWPLLEARGLDVLDSPPRDPDWLTNALARASELDDHVAEGVPGWPESWPLYLIDTLADTFVFSVETSVSKPPEADGRQFNQDLLDKINGVTRVEDVVVPGRRPDPVYPDDLDDQQPPIIGDGGGGGGGDGDTDGVQWIPPDEDLRRMTCNELAFLERDARQRAEQGRFVATVALIPLSWGDAEDVYSAIYGEFQRQFEAAGSDRESLGISATVAFGNTGNPLSMLSNSLLGLVALGSLTLYAFQMVESAFRAQMGLERVLNVRAEKGCGRC